MTEIELEQFYYRRLKTILEIHKRLIEEDKNLKNKDKHLILINKTLDEIKENK